MGSIAVYIELNIIGVTTVITPTTLVHLRKYHSHSTSKKWKLVIHQVVYYIHVYTLSLGIAIIFRLFRLWIEPYIHEYTSMPNYCEAHLMGLK